MFKWFCAKSHFITQRPNTMYINKIGGELNFTADKGHPFRGCTRLFLAFQWCCNDVKKMLHFCFTLVRSINMSYFCGKKKEKNIIIYK